MKERILEQMKEDLIVYYRDRVGVELPEEVIDYFVKG